MRLKITLAIVASLFASSLFAQTYYQERRNPVVNHPNHILFSPFYFFDGTFMLTYERLFPTGALRITPSIKLQNLSDQEYTQKEGWGLDAGYKFFFTSRPRAANFYMGPYGLYKNIKAKAPVPYESFSSSRTRYYNTDTYRIVSFGVDAGVKFIFGRFTMDLSFGGGIRYVYLNGETFENSEVEWYDIDYKGIVPRGNFSLGIAF